MASGSAGNRILPPSAQPRGVSHGTGLGRLVSWDWGPSVPLDPSTRARLFRFQFYVPRCRTRGRRRGRFRRRSHGRRLVQLGVSLIHLWKERVTAGDGQMYHLLLQRTFYIQKSIALLALLTAGSESSSSIPRGLLSGPALSRPSHPRPNYQPAL